MTERINKVIN